MENTMISREEFIEDVKIGDIIKISTKTENVVGKVERIGDTSVKITRLDSEKPKTISYSDIIGCDFEITSSTVETDNQRFEESIDLNEFYDSEKQEYSDLKPTYGLLTYVNFDQNLAYISNTFIKGGEYKYEETIRFSPSLFKLDMVDTRKFFYLVRYISHKYGYKIEIDESYPIEFLQKIERKCLIKAELNIDEDGLNIEKTDKDKIVVDFQAIASPCLVVNVPALVNGESFFYLKDSGIYSVANCNYIEDEILYTSDGVAINLDQQNIYRFATISDFDDKYGCLNGKNDVPLSLIDDKAYNILKTAGQSMFLCYSCSNNKLSRIERIPLELNSQLVWQKGKVTDSNITPRERSFTIDESVKHLLSVLSDGLINKKSREVGFKGTEIYYKKVSCPNWHDNKLNDFAIEVRCTSEPARIEYDSVRDKYLAYRNNTFFYEIHGSEEELKRLCGDQITVYFETTKDLHYLQAFVDSGEKHSVVNAIVGAGGFFANLLTNLSALENQKPNNYMSNKIQEQINKIVKEEVYTDNFYDEYTCLHIQLLRKKENTPRTLYRLFLSDFGEKSDIRNEILNENDERINYDDEIKLLFEKIPNDKKITTLLLHILILDENSYGFLSEIIDFNKLQELSEKLYKEAQNIDLTTQLPPNDIQRCFELLRDIYRRDKEKYISQLKGIEEKSAIGDTLPILRDINERFIRFCSPNDRRKLESIKNLCDKIDIITDDTPYSKQSESLNTNYNNAKKTTEHDTIEFYDLFISTGALGKLLDEIAKLRKILHENKKFWPNIKCDPNDPNIFGDEKELALVIKNQGGGQDAKNIKIHFDSSNLTSDCYQQEALKIAISQNGKTQEVKFNVNLTDWQNDLFELWGTLEYDHVVGFNNETGKPIYSTKKENINIKFQKDSEHSKIKKGFVKNPYKIPAHGEVLSQGDKMFYGRKEEINEIWSFISLNEQTLCNKKTIILYGQQKCGKTSLVNQIIQKIDKNERIKNSTIIVNLADVVSSQTDPTVLTHFKSAFYDKFFHEFEMAIHDDCHEDVIELLNNNNLKIPADIISISENMVENTFSNFIDKFNQIDGGKHKILLIMDEFTRLCVNIDKHIETHPEYQGILSFVKQISEKGLVQIIIGHEAMIRILSRLGFINETVDFSKTIELSALKKEDAVDLIKNPMKEVFGIDVYDSPLGEECIDYLLDLSGSSPWILMQICDYVFDEYCKSSDSKIILSKLKEWIENFVKSLIPRKEVFDFIFKEKGQYGNYEAMDTYKYLTSFAENCKNFSEYYRFNGSDVFDSVKNDQIKNDLVACHVLTNNNGKIRINIGLLTLFLKRSNGFGGEGD